MVRNEQMPDMGQYAKAVAKAVRAATENAGISGAELGRRLGRAQSYASVRLQGRRAWTTDEVDQIAIMLDMPVDDLWRLARQYRD